MDSQITWLESHAVSYGQSEYIARNQTVRYRQSDYIARTSCCKLYTIKLDG